MSCWYNRSKVSRELILLRTDWTPQRPHCTQRNERLKSHREQDACSLLICQLRSKPRQLSITRHMLPIRSHALRKLHLLDFSLRSARDKSLINCSYLSSVGSEVIITLQLTTSRRHASLHAFVRRFAPSNVATRQPGLRPVTLLI